MTQAEIDAAETARVEALLQVCRWVAKWGAEFGAWQPFTPVDGYDGIEFLTLLTAVQQSSIEDRKTATSVVRDALIVLAHCWDGLPEGERDVVRVGILPAATEEKWRQYLAVDRALETDSELMGEAYTAALQERADLELRLVDSAVR